MKFLCYGAGAIGTYIGGSLGLMGAEVVFVVRPSAVRELRSRGLRLDRRRKGSPTTASSASLAPSPSMFCESLPEALERGPFDAVIYALKSFDTPAAAGEMRQVADRMPPVVCFSNGVENESILAQVLGKARVVPATVTTAIARQGPGIIIVERHRGIGIYAEHPLSRELLAVCRRAGLNPTGFRNADAMKWSKLLTNLVANPTSAILDMTAAEVLRHHGVYALEIGMLRECLKVMSARQTRLVDLPDTPVRAMALAAWLPPWASRPLLARAGGAGRGEKMPSLHIDLHSGRGRSEVEYLHGAVAREGQRHGIQVPINEFLTRTLMSLAQGDVPLDQFKRKPDLLLRVFREQAKTP